MTGLLSKLETYTEMGCYSFLVGELGCCTYEEIECSLSPYFLAIGYSDNFLADSNDLLRSESFLSKLPFICLRISSIRRLSGRPYLKSDVIVGDRESNFMLFMLFMATFYFVN